MADRHDYVALEWVKGELAETLKQARQALDAYSTASSQAADLAPCLSALHQARGSLEMIEFHGAALLAEEIEHLAQALQRGTSTGPGLAADLLRRAMEQLPLYLERVHVARRDLPLVVLPLINELRLAHGASVLAENNLFSPALLNPPPLSEDELARRSGPGLAPLLRKLRQSLQVALVGLLREPSDSVHLEHMVAVYSRLENLCQGSPIAPLWQIAAAVVEGVAQGFIADSRSLYGLLKNTEKTLGKLSVEGIGVLNRPASADLLRGLLFHLAKARGTSPRVRELAERHGLGDVIADDALIDQERARLAGPHSDALRTVVAALCEELVRHKEQLDAFVCGDRQQVAVLADMLPALRQIADALAVLGFQQPRKVIIDQLAVIQSLAQGQRAPEDAVLMDVAGALLYVEATLAGMVGAVEPASLEESRLPTTDIHQIHRLVIRESLAGIEQVKELLVDCVELGWSYERLLASAQVLGQLRGALAMVPLAHAAAVLAQIQECLAEWATHPRQLPGGLDLDRLAQAISAVEYFLERMLMDPVAPDDHLLFRAEHVMATLGEPEALSAAPRAAGEPGFALEALDEGLDRPLLEIFQNEAAGHLETLRRCAERPEQGWVVSDDLHLALHTLKGSAWMAGVLPIAELAGALDLLAREYKAHHFEIGTAEQGLLHEALLIFQQGLRQMWQGPQAPLEGAAELIQRSNALVAERLATYQESPSVRARRDPRLIAEFLDQGMDILLDTESLLHDWRSHPNERRELTALLDELTVLGQSAHLADLDEVDELCEALLDVYGAVEESSLAVGERFFIEAEHSHEALVSMLDQLAAGQAIEARPDRVRALRELLAEALDPRATGLVRAREGLPNEIAELEDATQVLRQHDELASIFLEEGRDLLVNAERSLERWLADPHAHAWLVSLQRDLHTLDGGARMAGVPTVSALSSALQSLYSRLAQGWGADDPALTALLAQAHEALASMLDQFEAGKALLSPEALIAALGRVPASADRPPAHSAHSDDASGELLDIFLEEGFDIVETAGASLLRWQAEPANSLEVENLLRDLHTLKGGARMVEVGPVGDLAHELETLYESLSTGQLQPSAELFKLLQKGHDRLAQMLDSVRLRQAVRADGDLLAAIQRFGVAEAPPPAAEPRTATSENPISPADRGPSDMVKVTAQALEDLGSLAGESSIVRSRLEQQIQDARYALQEMSTTLERMRDQLLRLDIETQGSPASRQQHDPERRRYEDFDPLELDHHSQLQQLSRGLYESASDLLDLKETLDARSHEAQALLGQQERLGAQLQDGLMRARMVPFGRLLPRLQRIVRQVAEELGKDVAFEVGNAEAEMDRSVLERMIAPLEHMLRNAVDHGLEPAQARLAAGKPEQGLITLSVVHQGGEVVIEMSDDGAGVPLEAVRNKAIKRGLLDPASDMNDHDVLQFILQPGFSTAQKVTQISGRGLGMDVVHEEVKQLGGSMTIDSRSGVGARFQIRLPLSVAVNRALLVQCGEELYAVPLNSIEGIVRVAPNELEAAYQTLPPRYRYAGVSHELRYLGELLQGATRPSLLGHSVPLPLLLVRAHDHQVALQVDAVAGSREIVVKSLGPQFASVQGLAGATLLGDGRVVLIIDLLGQLRAQQARQLKGGAAPREVEPAKPVLVMVVDDSVTVRKVTSRLLERHGMRVLTAKDGVDAMELLREHTPDVVLLDIEMPRMDGYEVAARVRLDPRLQHLPIIMITSRTGEKHRERAIALGVNDYLGKPYQEAQLLECIAQWSRQHA